MSADSECACWLRDTNAYRATSSDLPRLAEDEVRIAVRSTFVSGRQAKSADVAEGEGAVGKVVACGEAATLWMDRQVLVPAVQACGECSCCRAGHASSCSEGYVLGWNKHGGMSSQIAAKIRWLTPIDDTLKLDDVQAACSVGPLLRAYTLFALAGASSGRRARILGEQLEGEFLQRLCKARGLRLEDTPENHPLLLFVVDSDRSAEALAAATPGSTIACLCPLQLDEPSCALLHDKEITLLHSRYGHPDLLPEVAAMVSKGELSCDSIALADISELRPSKHGQLVLHP